MIKDEMLQAVNNALKPFLDKGLLLSVVSFSVLSPEGRIENWAFTLIPVPPDDHEDTLIRDNIAQQVSRLATQLTKQVYKL